MEETRSTSDPLSTELGVFFFLAMMLIPGVVVGLICTYGFIVWMVE